MSTQFLVHLNPVWRDRANFIIHAIVEDEPSAIRFEQLWARQISDNRFEICCIPVFAYDLALGDEVETGTQAGKQYVVQRVLDPSGHYTFRLWFGESRSATVREEVVAEIQRLSGLCESYSKNLLGVDAASDAVAREIAHYLAVAEKKGDLTYETGRTR